jgi:hypothetical protein
MLKNNLDFMRENLLSKLTTVNANHKE